MFYAINELQQDRLKCLVLVISLEVEIDKPKRNFFVGGNPMLIKRKERVPML